ncbi:MAG: InlB B-repeat-containing protein [Eggerthellaceae bacterium]|nr:InlB B-repeat-containing protein [Eggerthellaceae bacterium]
MSKKRTDAPFTNTLTKATDGTVTFKSSNTGVASVNGSTGQVTIKGAGKATITASAVAGKNYKAGSASYTLNVASSVTYAVSYNANGGTGTPSAQTKQKGAALTLSSAKPGKSYLVSYNANGGSVSPASKSVSCTFKNWNTARNGSGTTYAPGSKYAADADATLYAQWANPAAGTLATPKRSGHTFLGWYTSASGGSRVAATTVITASTTLYAHWDDPYNMGDESYSFRNFGDSDSPFGHCFGMSMTSAGYHNGLLSISRIGGNANTPLYSFGNTQIVRDPICYVQDAQQYSAKATVAGGSYYLRGVSNIASDWQAVVNYVKSHSYDDTGLLQIGFRKSGEGGHAINFLRYEKVNGQDRIYAYDNNFPDRETYFYRDSYGRVLQAPVQTFSGAIDCIALRDVRTFFRSLGDFDATRIIYVLKGEAVVQGYTYVEIDADAEYVMYEIPKGKNKVTIVPAKDNADIIYRGTEYSFGKITDATRGELRLVSESEENAGVPRASITRLAGAHQWATSRVIAEWAMGRLANGTGGSAGLYQYASIRFQPEARLSANNAGVSRGDL